MDREELRERVMEFAVRAKVLQNADQHLGGTTNRRAVDRQHDVCSDELSCGRTGRSRAEFITKIGLVPEEADESAGWLELITRWRCRNSPS
jgi:hypothetical protein